MKELHVPITDQDIQTLQVGQRVLLSGWIYCGRDAVLPKVVRQLEAGCWDMERMDLRGSVVFHTAVSPAGVGPTSSNKLEIERSMEPLSRMAGVKIHLGKGAISPETVKKLQENRAVYAILPPVTALLGSRTSQIELAAFPELGMEALYRIRIDGYPVIIAAAQGESLYDGTRDKREMG